MLVACLLIFAPATTPAQAAQRGGLTLEVEAGFSGHFRADHWLPVTVQIANDGPDVSGRLVVRPATSGAAITNVYSTPVVLPGGARQTAQLYINARSFAAQLRVELIDDQDQVIAARQANLNSVLPQDRLYAVVTDSPIGSVDLTQTRTGEFAAFQADWRARDLPEVAAALDAVDVLLFSDSDTAVLSSAQQTALAQWVSRGGHLIVTGGANWQATAAGVGDLLPFTPEAGATVDGLGPLADWLRFAEGDLGDRTVIATGALKPTATALVSLPTATADQPLLARWAVGGGTVDYLSAEPNAEPLRSWDGLDDLWFALITSPGPAPSWSHGIVDNAAARSAVEILPGFDPLPDVLPLCGFLAAYIALIGPLNYMVLNRINRREWAWVSIPIFIVIFSALAWLLGTNLRGNEATLTRLSLVQSWPNLEAARVDSVVGLLSPSRIAYDLGAGPTESLRPIPESAALTNPLGTDAPANVEIVQTEQFTATDFIVDASFIAGFEHTGTVEAPAISGTARFGTNAAGQPLVRGSVRNDSALTLDAPRIITRRGSISLNRPTLAPGELATFDLVLPLDGEGVVPASAFYYPTDSTINLVASQRWFGTARTTTDILGATSQQCDRFRFALNERSAAEQATCRRELFVSAVVDDVYNANGSGDQVYLIGWHDSAPLALDVAGANWRADDETLYVIALSVEPPSSSAGTLIIPPDRFTWTLREQQGFGIKAPVGLSMNQGEEAIFQFTPLPDAVLETVTTLTVQLRNFGAGRRTNTLDVWQWVEAEWETVTLSPDTWSTNDPARFLGPLNAVRVRIVSEDFGGFRSDSNLLVSQAGR
ncbi:MAG: hypothetical protein GYB67_03315 [Chloroflexi bacterium]|nr:hypothetical protein [Chloroflexota bacterium]